MVMMPMMLLMLMMMMMMMMVIKYYILEFRYIFFYLKVFLSFHSYLLIKIIATSHITEIACVEISVKKSLNLYI